MVTLHWLSVLNINENTDINNTDSRVDNLWS